MRITPTKIVATTAPIIAFSSIGPVPDCDGRDDPARRKRPLAQPESRPRSGASRGTVSKASLAQPALSRQISDLEHELGLMLFDRVGRRLPSKNPDACSCSHRLMRRSFGRHDLSCSKLSCACVDRTFVNPNSSRQRSGQCRHEVESLRSSFLVTCAAAILRAPAQQEGELLQDRTTEHLDARTFPTNPPIPAFISAPVPVACFKNSVSSSSETLAGQFLAARRSRLAVSAPRDWLALTRCWRSPFLGWCPRLTPHENRDITT
jgi:hypothetical protein